MAAHRYWRARNLSAYDGGATVELSEFWLLAGGSRVDASATLTSDIAPVSGSLADLRDNDTGTGAVLDKDTVLTWDFDTSPEDVDDIRLGAAAARLAFLMDVTLEWSDDGINWTHYFNFYRIQWPDIRELTVSTTGSVRLIAFTPFQQVSGTTLSVVVPDVVVEGDMLLVALSRRSAMTSVPAGFINVSESGPFSATGESDQWSAAYLRVATTSDALSTLVFEQTTNSRFNIQLIVLRAAAGSPALRSEVVQEWQNSGSYLVSFPSRPDISDDSSLSVAIASMTISTTANLAWSVNNLWVRHDPATGNEDRRLYVVTKPVSLGVSVSGTLTTSMSDGSIGGESSHVLTFASNPRIARGPAWGGTSKIGLAAVSSLGATPPFTTAPLIGAGWRALPDFRFDPLARGRIIGTVKRKNDPSNVPLARRVRLYRDIDGMLVRETWSNAAGDYVFEHIEEGMAYTVITWDHEHDYRAVAADNLTLANGGVELM